MSVRAVDVGALDPGRVARTSAAFLRCAPPLPIVVNGTRTCRARPRRAATRGSARRKVCEARGLYRGRSRARVRRPAWGSDYCCTPMEEQTQNAVVSPPRTDAETGARAHRVRGPTADGRVPARRPTQARSRCLFQSTVRRETARPCTLHRSRADTRVRPSGQPPPAASSARPRRGRAARFTTRITSGTGLCD